MDNDNYLMLLLAGVAVVVIDGQILYQSGKRYLTNYGGDRSGASLVRLVAVLFHLVALGLLALITTIEFGGTGIQGLVARLGVILLVVALVHAAALGLLARLRENDQAEAQAVPARGERERQALYDPVVTPVAGQEGPEPEVSPGIEDRGPYRA